MSEKSVPQPRCRQRVADHTDMVDCGDVVFLEDLCLDHHLRRVRLLRKSIAETRARLLEDEATLARLTKDFDAS